MTCDWQEVQFSLLSSRKKECVTVINGKRHQPEKQQLCLFEVRAGFNFLEGVFCALVRIFLTPLITQVW